MNVLIATNNFWIGGRETYIATYLGYLNNEHMKSSLLASSFFPDTPEAEVFENRWVCGAGDYATRWRNWLKQAEEFMAKDRPTLIWAHHYDLFPAWVISRLYKIPLLTTFHGPLIEVNRPNDPMQALGMTLAIFRGNAISGVSEEVISTIEALTQDRRQVYLIPNPVETNEDRNKEPPASKPRKLVLITRPEKLEHIRKAVLFFNAFRQRVRKSTLTIAGGRTPDERGENQRRSFSHLQSKAKFIVKYLGGKWCYEQGGRFLPSLTRIRFNGYTSEPRELIRKADAVLGMGRVVLEGLAEGKPCVLVGYENVCGLVTDATFEKFRRSNFSGRGMEAKATDEVCDELLGYCMNGKKQSKKHLDSISIERCGDELRKIMEEVKRFSEFENREISLAKKLADGITARHLRTEDLYSLACRDLNTQELSCLYSLSVG